MSMFSNAQNEAKEAMVKYMEAFIELASLAPEVEKTDLAALHNLSMYIKDDCDLAPEVADGYRAVYDRVYDMIFTKSFKHTPYTIPYKGVYQHHVDYKTLGKDTSCGGKELSKLSSLVFDKYGEAENFYSKLTDYISFYGTLTVKEVINEYDAIHGSDDYKSNLYDSRFGWTNLPSRPSDVIVRDSGSWKVVLPKPAELHI